MTDFILWFNRHTFNWIWYVAMFWLTVRLWKNGPLLAKDC